ncbi:MAG: type II secretion system F family protein [Boseongicola sp.]|nr:type II secretion system F family protein [Boseongicola sp.]
MFNNPIIFYALIFAAALLVVDTVLRTIFSVRRKSTDVSNRLEAIKQKTGVDAAFGQLLKNRGLAARDGEQSVGSRINKFIGQTGLEMSTAARIQYLVAIYVVSWLTSFIFLGLGTVMQYVVPMLMTIVIVIFLLSFARQRRIKKFTAQLPDAIDIIVRSLGAGHPLDSAISLVAREMPDPIGSEFGILSDQMTFGSELEQAMLNMHDRVGAPEVNLLTVSVSVQRGTGGNLAEILANLGQMIRDRLMLRAKIRAISSEGRMTGKIMVVFPFGLFYMIKFLVPDYYDLVWESGYGGYIVAGCLVGIFLGAIVINRLVNFDF